MTAAKPAPPSEAMQLWKDYRDALLDGIPVREAGGAEVTEAILALEARVKELEAATARACPACQERRRA